MNKCGGFVKNFRDLKFKTPFILITLVRSASLRFKTFLSLFLLGLNDEKAPELFHTGKNSGAVFFINNKCFALSKLPRR